MNVADTRTMDPMTANPGTLLSGRYRIDEPIGRGGMGVVYEAEDVALQRRVALKILRLPAQLGPGLAEQVLREARAAARPRVVVIGYLSENICRNVNVFRPFYNPTTVFPLAKPRYLLDGEGLRLLRNPLPTPDSYRRLLASPAEVLAELGRHDAHYRTRSHSEPWDRSATVRLLRLAVAARRPIRRDGCYGDDEAFAVTTRLFRLFYETVLRDGAQPVILIFPARDDVTRWRREHRKSYEPMLRFLDGQGYRVVDAMEVFDEAGRDHSIDELIPSHLSPLANRLVAEHLRGRLRGFGLIGPPAAGF